MPILGPVCTDDPTCRQLEQLDQDFTGPVSMGSTLSVAGGTTLHALTQTGTLTKSGALNLTGDLSVTGEAGVTTGDVSINTLGKGLKIKAGSNGKAGTFTANGSTAVVVSTTAVTANSVIVYGLKTVGGTPAGKPYESAIVPGTSFSVKAAVGDTSVYNWMILDSF